MPKRSVIVLPDDTGKPIVDTINAAKKSLRIKMFVFSDPDLIAAVIAAQKRGVKVRVMLNPARRDGEEDNVETRKQLEKAGVDVKDSNPDFGVTHESTEVKLVDEKDIPWDDLAFPSTEFALRRFIEDRAAGVERHHVAEMPRRF